MTRHIDQTIYAAARLRALEAQPFLASALFALVPVSRPGLGTFAVDDRWRVYIDPDVLDRWGAALSAGVLLHEVAHVVRDHAGRAFAIGVDASSSRRWNVAADAEINDALLRDGIQLPKNGVTSRMLRLPPHRAAEFYFDALADRRELPQVNCGSGAHGVPTWDVGFDDSFGAPGIEPAEQDLIRRMVAIAIRQHAASAGSVPGEWQRWAEATLDPKIPWQRLLRSSVRSGVGAVAGRADYSYSRPSRRRVPDVVLPSLVRPVPSVAIVVDTSGSMDRRALDRAWSEVLGCCRSLGVRRDLLRVYGTDVVTTRVRAVRRRAALMGGGGTDLRDGLRTALAASPRPDLVIVLTDGFTPWPDAPPACRVIAGMIQLSQTMPVPVPPPPPWVTRVDIDD